MRDGGPAGDRPCPAAGPTALAAALAVQFANLPVTGPALRPGRQRADTQPTRGAGRMGGHRCPAASRPAARGSSMIGPRSLPGRPGPRPFSGVRLWRAVDAAGPACRRPSGAPAGPPQAQGG